MVYKRLIILGFALLFFSSMGARPPDRDGKSFEVLYHCSPFEYMELPIMALASDADCELFLANRRFDYQEEHSRTKMLRLLSVEVPIDLTDEMIKRISRYCGQLECLNLRGAGISAIGSLDFLPHLRYLDASFNPCLTRLPEGGGRLKIVDLSYTGLDSITSRVERLHRVRSFIAKNCPISLVSSEIYETLDLNLLDLRGCPLEEEGEDISTWGWKELYEHFGQDFLSDFTTPG